MHYPAFMFQNDIKRAEFSFLITSPSLEAFGIVTKTSTSPLEETMKLICLALFLTLGLVSGKPGKYVLQALSL